MRGRCSLPVEPPPCCALPATLPLHTRIPQHEGLPWRALPTPPPRLTPTTTRAGALGAPVPMATAGQEAEALAAAVQGCCVPERLVWSLRALLAGADLLGLALPAGAAGEQHLQTGNLLRAGAVTLCAGRLADCGALMQARRAPFTVRLGARCAGGAAGRAAAAASRTHLLGSTTTTLKACWRSCTARSPAYPPPTTSTVFLGAAMLGDLQVLLPGRGEAGWARRSLRAQIRRWRRGGPGRSPAKPQVVTSSPPACPQQARQPTTAETFYIVKKTQKTQIISGNLYNSAIYSVFQFGFGGRGGASQQGARQAAFTRAPAASRSACFRAMPPCLPTT